MKFKDLPFGVPFTFNHMEKDLVYMKVYLAYDFVQVPYYICLSDKEERVGSIYMNGVELLSGVDVELVK